MAELQLGGKTIATQSGTNNPVLSSNVMMDNVNVNNALASAIFPAGHVIQTRSVTTYVAQSSQVDVTYATTSGTLSATLDSNGIYRLKDSEGSYLTIPNFSAKQGNLLIGTISYGGPNRESLSWYSMGVQWGSENRRTFKKMGYDGGGNYHAAESTVILYTCLEDLNNVDVHAILRIEESGKTMDFATHDDTTANATNWGRLGGSYSDVAFYFIVQEVQQ